MGTTTQAAAAIRGELKARGWSARAVSVRSDSYSMGSAIRVVVRDASVPISVVREIANAHERVSRDASGEILSGGNRFVDVDYSSEALASLRAEIESLLRTVESDPGLVVDVAPGVSACRDERDLGMWRAWGPAIERDVRCHGIEFCARQVAELVANERALLALRPRTLTADECAETLPVPGLAPVVSLASRRGA